MGLWRGLAVRAISAPADCQNHAVSRFNGRGAALRGDRQAVSSDKRFRRSCPL